MGREKKLLFKKAENIDIEFDFLLKTLAKHQSTHINMNCLNNNLIDFDFIYDKRSFNSTKCFNAKIYKSDVNAKHSTIEVKLNKAFLLLVFISTFVLISIPVFQNAVQLYTGGVALISINAIVFLLLRFSFFEENFKKLIAQLLQLKTKTQPNKSHT